MARRNRRRNPEFSHAQAVAAGAMLGAVAAGGAKYFVVKHDKMDVYTFDENDYPKDELEAGYVSPTGVASEPGTVLDISLIAAIKGAVVGGLVGLLFNAARRTRRQKNPSSNPNPFVFGTTAALASVLATQD